MPNLTPNFLTSPWQWLELHWARPAYAGTVLFGVAAAFFGAAVNTMAGWLYVMSGGIIALLLVALISPRRSLQRLVVNRLPIRPVHAGTSLWLELNLLNPTGQPRSLLEIMDMSPANLRPANNSKPPQRAVERIDPGGTYVWRYAQPTEQRGIYHWDMVQLKSGAPLGLFWSARRLRVKAQAIVYPQILPLSHCPVIDQIGADLSMQTRQERQAQLSNDGLTRALRPYRWGDPTRLIHWRTSARYGELRVRELEELTSGQDVVIALDSGSAWPVDAFEQAVMAAASLYRYAHQRGLQGVIWTAGTGLVQGGDRATFEVLAAIQAGETATQTRPNQRSLLWLTAQADTITTLPSGSHWLWWAAPIAGSSHGVVPPPGSPHAGIAIAPDQDLAQQLQARLHC